MFRRTLFTTVAVLAGSALVAQAAPKDEVSAAAKKLSDANGYAWKSDTQMQGGQGGGQGRGGRIGGPTEGKIEKDGFAHLTMTRGDNTIEAVVKGDKGAIKTQDGWKSLEEASEGGGGDAQQAGFRGGRMLARTLQNFRAPAAEAEAIASKSKELKQDGDAFAGDLTEDGAKELLSFRGGRRGGDNANFTPPAPTNPRGTAKFWVKDGVLTKYEYNVKGTMSFQGNDVDIDRTTTVEIKDVGNTKVEVPQEAKAKVEKAE